MSSLKITQVRVTVAVAGTPQPLSATELKVPAALVIADPQNSGTIYVGDSIVDASARLGAPLVASQDLEMDPTQYYGTSEFLDLSKIFVDTTSNGDAVIVTYFAREAD